MYLERLRIFAVRLFTGIDQNGPNNRNELPELTCVCGTVSSMLSGLKTRALGLNTLGTT